MGRKSTISRLPPEVKAFIEGQLAEGRCTLAELIDELQRRFPAHQAAGTLPSHSSVQRYGQKINRRLAAIKASTEAARLITEAAGDEQDARSEAVIALVQTEMFESIVAIQEAVSEEISAEDRLSLMSKAAKNIATLTRASIAQKQYKAAVLAKAQAAADTVDKLARRGGLTAETAEQIRREILGIAA